MGPILAQSAAGGASTLVGERFANATKIVSFRAHASPATINNFYREELRKRQWTMVIEGSNSADGLYFTKPKRSVRIIAVPLNRVESEVHLLLKKRPNEQRSAVIMNLLSQVEYPAEIPGDVPVYRNARPEATKKPEKWREFASTDSVRTIASWYASHMEANGWTVYLDNSEQGDSMVIYAKDTRYIGVRINDRDEYRNLTIILYPKGVIIPKLKSPSMLARSPKQQQ